MITLFREVPGVSHAIGGLVIILGVALVVIGQNRSDAIKELWHKMTRGA